MLGHLAVCGERPAAELGLLLHSTSRAACVFFFGLSCPCCNPKNTGPVPSSGLALTSQFFHLQQISCLSVVVTEGFFSYVLLTSFLVKGKQDPEVKGCGGNSSVNVHLHFYTNQVLTEIMLLLWAFCTDFPVNDFLAKSLIQTMAFNSTWEVSMRPFQLKLILYV